MRLLTCTAQIFYIIEYLTSARRTTDQNAKLPEIANTPRKSESEVNLKGQIIKSLIPLSCSALLE